MLYSPGYRHGAILRLTWLQTVNRISFLPFKPGFLIKSTMPTLHPIKNVWTWLQQCIRMQGARVRASRKIKRRWRKWQRTIHLVVVRPVAQYYELIKIINSTCSQMNDEIKLTVDYKTQNCLKLISHNKHTRNRFNLHLGIYQKMHKLTVLCTYKLNNWFYNKRTKKGFLVFWIKYLV